MKFQEIFIKKYYRISKEGNQLIKTKITERDLSRAKIASLVGISEGYADHLIRNDRNFREDKLLKMLPFLSVNLSSDYFIPQNTFHGKFMTLPRESSPELMQIIGYFLGDGNLQNRSIRFKDSNKKVLRVYQKLIEKTFNVKGKIVPQKKTIAYLLEINSLYLRNWFKENIILRKKKFLERVKQLPKKEVATFLRGLFDAEGCVASQSRQIRLGLTDEVIGRILPHLLFKLGITSSFYRIKRKESNWKDVYLISLNNRIAFKKFSDLIKFSSKEKIKKLNLLFKNN